MKIAEKYNKYRSKDSTHLLMCRHAIGKHGRDYEMPCIILKTTKNGKLKLLVFGERNWKRNQEKKSIRYVDFKRIMSKPITIDQ